MECSLSNVKTLDFEEETTLEINQGDFLPDGDFTTEKNKHPEVGKGFTTENPDNEDGYINVTNLCKNACNKFYKLKRLDKTKVFLNLLSSTAHICTDLLIISETEEVNENKATWVYPYVAINIALI